ncbi:MAG: peptidoglycan DD-metalloendopeptidase family protein [Ferruginibacter sp.]|nr:peptidoglycan DD-metalloendopeptidase family protein [Ferruginibacter sp.]
MVKILLSFLATFIFCSAIAQQPGQQELEKQRQQLKREIEQTQQLLDNNKKTTKESLGQLALLNRKLNLQGNVIDNISKDINLLNNTIFKSQKDINKLQLLIDTLKQEYSKSMVYAYKNRSNSDFLNFIFSSSSFNDAIKRITYLKSYRNYREMQGENILRTQDLLKQRIGELSGNKKKKSQVLQIQSKELTVLETQQQEKNQLVSKLKAQGKELNSQIAAKKKQMKKVSNAIAAAIKRAQDEARKEAIAKAKLAKARLDAETKANNTDTKNTATNTAPVKAAPAKTKQAAPVSVLLASDADVKLNANFEINRGSLPWPVDKGYTIMRFGTQRMEDVGIVIDNPGITIGSDVGNTVKSLFDGEVSSVTNIDNMQVVIIKHGRYFTTYSNLTNVSVARGQSVRTGQSLGRVAANDEGVGSIDLIISNEKSNLNPEGWLRRR